MRPRPHAPARARPRARPRRSPRTTRPSRRPSRRRPPPGPPSPASPPASSASSGSKCREVRERTVSRMEPALDRRLMREEVVVVLMLSFLGSAVFAIIDLLSAPIAGVYVAAGNPSNELAKQIFGVVFGLAPVYLVLHLVRRTGEGVRAIGLDGDRPGEDLRRGVVLFVLVGIAGLGVYLGAVALHVNRYVIPVPLGHWWTPLALVLNAAEAALKEEVIVVASLVTRLQQLGWSDRRAI